MTTKIKLNYRVIGAGYPVVFLHGFLENNSMWNTITPKLKGVKAILIELPGHGNSPTYPDNENMTIRNISLEVNEILKVFSLDKYSIVGHSLGGYVALDLKKIDAKNTIEKVVLLNSHPWCDSPAKKKERSRIVNIVEHNKSLFLNEAIPNLFSEPSRFRDEIQYQLSEANKMPKEGIIQSLIAMRDRKNCLKVMNDLREKCFVIQGKYDHLIPYRKMKALVDKYNNKYYLVNKAGHMAHIESSKEVIDQLKKIIEH